MKPRPLADLLPSCGAPVLLSKEVLTADENTKFFLSKSHKLPLWPLWIMLTKGRQLAKCVFRVPAQLQDTEFKNVGWGLRGNKLLSSVDTFTVTSGRGDEYQKSTG